MPHHVPDDQRDSPARARHHRQEHQATAAFATYSDAGTLTVTVRGPLDALTAPDLTAHVVHAVTDGSDHYMLVLDLRNLDFLAVAGARALVGAAAMCAARGIGCHLVLPADHPARTVLDRIDATRALQIVEDPHQITDRREP